MEPDVPFDFVLTESALSDDASFDSNPSMLSPPGTILKAAALPGAAKAAPAVFPPGLKGKQEAGAASILAPGISVSAMTVAGIPCSRVEWCIDDLRSRLQAVMGRPLVSPPFATCGLPNLRLMVFPDARDTIKNARSRERKGMYANMIRKGPLYGALRLKADCLDKTTSLPQVRFYLTIGDARRGPFSYDFSEQAIHGCNDFDIDWLKQLDDTGCLRVGVEILEVTHGDAMHSYTAEAEPLNLYSNNNRLANFPVFEHDAAANLGSGWTQSKPSQLHHNAI